MSLSTYTGLKAEVASFLNRSDLTLNIPTFISLAEAEIQRVLRRTTKRSTVTVAEESFAIPATVAELRSLRFVTSSRSRDLPISIVTPEQLSDTRARGEPAGRPRAAAVVGTNLLFAPAPDAVYDMEIAYFEKLVPLSASVATNVVLAEAPDVYLYGALREASAFLEHDERIPVWSTKFTTALDQLAVARQREEHGASLRPARLPVVF
jgi:hypothetical protein